MRSFQAIRPAPSTIDDSPDWKPVINVESVFKLLSTLKVNKAPGIDKIPTIIYKRAASVLAAPLAHIINVSVLSRRFPVCWKHSIIVPVPKTNPPSRDELRPISLMTVPSKICERLVLNTGLQERFDDAFGPMQFGCRKFSRQPPHWSAYTTLLLPHWIVGLMSARA